MPREAVDVSFAPSSEAFKVRLAWALGNQI